MHLKLLIYLFAAVIILHQPLFAQEDTTIKSKSKASSKANLKDTLDGKFDFSSFLIDAKGFIPVPFIITEPAVGGLGLAVVPIFLTPKKKPAGYTGYIAPDITAAFAMYTVNNSWMVGGMRIGSIPAKGLKYRIGGGIADLNLSFYRDIANKGEKEFEFSVKAVPLIFSLSKRISKQEVYLGMQYFFAKNKLTPLFIDSLPSSIKSGEFESNVASLGTFIDWDKRDNFFTPDKGARINIAYSANDNWTGSDFTYQKLSGTLNWFIPVQKNWISGFRVETNFMFGDPPFYALPSLALRGVPAVRFQGYTTALVETEQRIDLSLRWSAVAFAGLGKALDRNESFGNAETAYNFGGGFRYLIARLFRIRAGIDVAKGPDSWGWYIVFGHNWNR
ncbi:MAG: glyceraldehyde-3-phosphate dehydrogenase [Bacteroidetes bacterium]|nr:MAG: glyceraldehyde-3-phosphate dehydrogenase [Bacteroidota bacterium]